MKHALCAGLLAIIICASLALADTCGPKGCDPQAPAAETKTPPSVVQSNWRKAALPSSPPKTPMTAPPGPQTPSSQGAKAATSSPTLATGFSEQEALPDLMVVPQKVSPDTTTPVRLSNSDINRVICPVDIKDVIYSEEKGLTVNLSGKNAYVKFLVVKKDGRDLYSATPSEIYFVCGDAVYTMIAAPARIPAQLVELVNGPAQIVMKNMELFGELPFEKKVLAIVKRVYTGDLPDSIVKAVANKRMEVFKDLEVTLRATYAIEGEGLRVKEFEVRIPPGALESVSFKESDFLRTGISTYPVAVCAEFMTLRKGEASRVFVVERTEGGQS